MKIAVFVLIACLAAVISARPEKYTTKYDNIDLDNILNSDRLINNYFKCLMERGNCTPDGKELRNSLSDALETDCTKCSQKQKDGSKKMIRFLVRNKPDMWTELMSKYDPDVKYRQKYEDEARAEGIAVKG